MIFWIVSGISATVSVLGFLRLKKAFDRDGYDLRDAVGFWMLMLGGGVTAVCVQNALGQSI